MHVFKESIKYTSGEDLLQFVINGSLRDRKDLELMKFTVSILYDESRKIALNFVVCRSYLEHNNSSLAQELLLDMVKDFVSTFLRRDLIGYEKVNEFNLDVFNTYPIIDLYTLELPEKTYAYTSLQNTYDMNVVK